MDPTPEEPPIKRDPPATEGTSKRKSEVQKREDTIMEMLRADFTQTYIAQELGIDQSTVSKTQKRLLERHTVGNLEEMRLIEDDRISAMMQGVYPKARSGNEKSIHAMLKLQERRSKFWGLDHADGIADRQQSMNEAIAMMLIKGMEVITSNLGLTDEQLARLPAVMETSMIELEAASDGS